MSIKFKLQKYETLINELIKVNIEREKIIALIPGIPEPDEKQIAKDTENKFFEDIITELEEMV